MRILFSTFGSLGDLHPYIAIALEAKKRGHEPVLATSPKYRAKIEALGLEFRAIRPDLPSEENFGDMAKRVMDLKDGPRYLFQEVLGPAMRHSYEDLLEASEDADVIITHPAVMAGPLVGQKTGKKWLSSALAPISLWSKSDPPVPPTAPQLDFLRALGPLWPKIMFAAGKAGTKSWVTAVDMLRREIGVESLGHPMFEGQHSPYGTLALFSPHFVKPQQDWPVNTTATGFCFYDATGYIRTPKEPEPELSYQEWVDSGQSPLDWPSYTNADGTTYYGEKETPSTHLATDPDEDAWKAWMHAGEAPIVFALGSSAVFEAAPFWEQSEVLVKSGGARAVFLTGGQKPFGDRQLGPEMLELNYAPYSELFPLGKFVVHQGGAGTTAQALRAGVPQLIVPHAHDQPDHAGRVNRLGLGHSLGLERYLKGEGTKVMQKMRTEYPQLKRAAEELGEKIRAENGPATACEAIERGAA